MRDMRKLRSMLASTAMLVGAAPAVGANEPAASQPSAPPQRIDPAAAKMPILQPAELDDALAIAARLFDNIEYLLNAQSWNCKCIDW